MTHRRCQSGLRWALAQLAVALALQPHLIFGQANSTLAADVDALVEFAYEFQPVEGTLLATWGSSSDPCSGDGWPGVLCQCSDLPIIAAAGCSDTPDPSGSLRVKGLDLHQMSSGIRRLQGPVPTALGSLDQLVYLDLSSNQLSGPVPDQLQSLQRLQWLQLSGNLLNGNLPAYLGQLPRLQTVQLQNNNLSGPVPSGWCTGNATYDVSGNAYLCGVLPRCFLSNKRIISMAQTYISSTTLILGSTGGACDGTPPGCDADVGCVIWTPKYWTNISFVQFNFTGFVDYESSVAKYAWGLGTAPYANDVVPLTQVIGSKLLKDIRFSGSSKQMFVTVVYYTLPSFSLVNGMAYYVTVVAYNGAGPPLTTNSTSAAVYVDQTGPVPGMVYNTFQFKKDVTTNVMNLLQASWDDWSDPESGITGYYVQFYQVLFDGANGTRLFQNVTNVISVGLVKMVQMKSTMLTDGMVYYANITATNGAGLNTSILTLPITVVRATVHLMTPGTAAMIAIICGIGCLVLGAGAQYVMMNIRMATETQREKERQQEQKQLKQLMYALSAHTDSLGGQGSNNSMTAAPRAVDIHAKELAFVFTDIENSTEISNQDPTAFKEIQEAHDQILREGIAKHRGYEIITEGDSFQVAFATCQAAIQFCLDVQYRLLEQSWSKEILKLHACRVVRVTGDYNQVVFAGPRVRMGVHYAHPGTVAMRTHNITRQNVYGGPAIKIGSEVSDIAAGGQILLTEEAVMKLAENLSQAGFPVIKLCGQYKLESTYNPVFLYSCNEQVGKPLKRTFGDLRKVKKVWPNADSPVPAVLEYNIHPPPVPEGKNNALTFVSLRLATYPKSGCNIPEHIQRRFLEVFAVQTQQFKGYMFQTCADSLREGIWTAGFSYAMDALRFTHAAQLLLMHTQWPTDARPFCGEALPGADGRWVFQGPRVCMAIHQSADYFVSEDSSTGVRTSMVFAGAAVTLPLILTYAGRGGQVILSEAAWEAVKGTVVHHPGAVRIISLGTHIVSDDFPQPMLLMEVMPNLLSKRVFQSMLTKQMIEPGYRDAPDPKDPMAIVFVKVSKPREVEEAEKGTSKLHDDEVKLLVQENQVALGLMGATVRKLLKLYNGYECKEPEPGKFTLAFHKLEDAICWGCHFQEELLFVSWPHTLLEQCSECSVQLDPVTGLPIWRGLRVKVGMSYGMVNSKKPLNTGRADYYGVLANGAARVMALAAPGQVLIEAQAPPTVENPATHKHHLLLRPDDGTLLPMRSSVACSLALSSISPQQDATLKDLAPEGHGQVVADGWRCAIQADGYYLLRGLSNARLIYKAYSERLGDRGIKITSQERLAPPPLGLNHSFASSRDSMKLFGSWVSSFRAKHLAGRSSPTDSGCDSRHSKIPAVRNPSSIRNSPTADSAAAFAVTSDDISPKDATSDLSGLSPRKSSSRLSAGQMPRARSQEFGPGSRAGSNSGEASQGSAGSFAELPDVLSAHGRRSRSWVGPVRRYSSLGSSQQTHSFTSQDPGPMAARSSSSGLIAQAAAGHFRRQLQLDGTVRHASAPGATSDLYAIRARLAPIQTRVASSGASSGGSSLTTTPTPAGSSYSPGPVEASNPIQQQQQLYLHLQAPRVVQQHRAAEGSVPGQNAVHNVAGQSHEVSVDGSLELTPAMGPLDNIRSHSQLLLAQQRSQQHMQQMVHKKESGHASSSSSWDGAGGLKGVLSSLAGLTLKERRPMFRILSMLKLPGRTHIAGGSYDGEEVQAAEAQQQHGILPGGNMPRAPVGAGSYGRSHAPSNPEASPSKAYAIELGEAYVTHRKNSATAQQMLATLAEARAASYTSAFKGSLVGADADANAAVSAAMGRQADYVYSVASYSPRHFEQNPQFPGTWSRDSQLHNAAYSTRQPGTLIRAASGPPSTGVVVPLGQHEPPAEPSAIALELSLAGSMPNTPTVLAAGTVAAPARLESGYSPLASPEPASSAAKTAARLHQDMWRSHDEHMLGQSAQQTAEQQQQQQEEEEVSPSSPSFTARPGFPAEQAYMQQQQTAQRIPSTSRDQDSTCSFQSGSAVPIIQVPVPEDPVCMLVRTAAASGVPFSVSANQPATGPERLVLRLTDEEQAAAAAAIGDSAMLFPAPRRPSSRAGTLQHQLEQARQTGNMILTSLEYGTHVRQQQQQREQEQRCLGMADVLQLGQQGASAADVDALVQDMQERQQQQQLDAMLQAIVTQQYDIQDPQVLNYLLQRISSQQQQQMPQQIQQALQQMEQQRPLSVEPKNYSQTTLRSPLGFNANGGGNQGSDSFTAPQISAMPVDGTAEIGTIRAGNAPGTVGRPAAMEPQPDAWMAARAAAAAEAGAVLYPQQLSSEQHQMQRAAAPAAGSAASRPKISRADTGTMLSAPGIMSAGLYFGNQPGRSSPHAGAGTPRSGAGTPRSVHSRSAATSIKGGPGANMGPGDLRSRSLAVLGNSPSPTGSPLHKRNNSLGDPQSGQHAGLGGGAAYDMAWQQQGTSGLWSNSRYAEGSFDAEAEGDYLSDDEDFAGIYVGPPGMTADQLQQQSGGSGAALQAQPNVSGSRGRTPSVALDLIPEGQGLEGRQSDLGEEQQQKQSVPWALGQLPGRC